MKTVTELINKRDSRLIKEITEEVNERRGWEYNFPYNSWSPRKEKNKICDDICYKLGRYKFTTEEVLKAINTSDDESDFKELIEEIHKDIDGDTELDTDQYLIERIAPQVLDHISGVLGANTNLTDTNFNADFYTA